MKSVFTLTNAKIVTPHEVVEDTNVVIEDGIIASIGSDSKGEEIDLANNYLLPGLIDLHCDAIEKEMEPRSSVFMPKELAIRQIDTRNLVAGITTIYHCLSFAGEELGVRSSELSSDIINHLAEQKPHLTVKNKVHARFEISRVACEPYLTKLIEQGKIDILSFMDHGQGQGQFITMEEYRDFLVNNYQISEAEAERRINAKNETKHQAQEAMQRLADLCKSHSIPLVSHDDDTKEKVDSMRALGVTASEFPLNKETAQYAREHGIMTLAGAPNVIRGRSQGNGMSALTAIEADVINVLSSDYIPNALLPAAFKVHDVLDVSLSDAINLVTKNPAAINPNPKTGCIVEGLCADLISVKTVSTLPVVDRVWINGKSALNRTL